MRQVKLVGLEGLEFLDNTNDMAKGHQNDKDVTFSGEVDRIYLKTPGTLQVSHHGRLHRVQTCSDIGFTKDLLLANSMQWP